MNTIGLASDHAGYPLKEQVKEWLKAMGYDLINIVADVVLLGNGYKNALESIGRKESEGTSDVEYYKKGDK